MTLFLNFKGPPHGLTGGGLPPPSPIRPLCPCDRYARNNIIIGNARISIM